MIFTTNISYCYGVILINIGIVITSFGQTTGDRFIQTGNTHLGKSYEINTLDGKKEEVLTIDTTQFDCVTFVECVVAQTLCKIPFNYSSFEKILTSLRYRNGNIDGYSSRLHYFSEWLLQAEKNGFGKNISLELGGELQKKQIHFMSTNDKKYPKLLDQGIFTKIKETEFQLSNKAFAFIPNRKIDNVLTKLQNGDIIAMVSSVRGLDISHTGFILLKNQNVHLLHASSRTKKVEITKQPLQQYLKTMPFIEGIIIFRNTIQ